MTKRQRWKSVAVCGAILLAGGCASRAASADARSGDAQADAQQQSNPVDPSTNTTTTSAGTTTTTTTATSTSATTSTGAPPQTSQQSNQPGNATQQDQTGTSNDRLFFALPNFLTIENSSQVPPLSAKEKFKVVARSSFDYVEYPWYGVLAGISQAENSEPGYGQGAQGYAKRYGAAFADGTIENFWTSAILPSVLHDDPRFYQMPSGGFIHRASYAASRIVVTRSDSGHSRFNAPEILGSVIAAVISTYSYHPRADRTVGNTASVWGSEVAYDTVTIEIKEFWPDIRRAFAHKSDNDPTAPRKP